MEWFSCGTHMLSVVVMHIDSFVRSKSLLSSVSSLAVV